MQNRAEVNNYMFNFVMYKRNQILKQPKSKTLLIMIYEALKDFEICHPLPKAYIR